MLDRDVLCLNRKDCECKTLVHALLMPVCTSEIPLNCKHHMEQPVLKTSADRIREISDESGINYIAAGKIASKEMLIRAASEAKTLEEMKEIMMYLVVNLTKLS